MAKKKAVATQPREAQGAPRSMTGFGRAESRGDRGRLWVEVRSVNGRFLKLNVKLPPRYMVFEERVRDLLERFGVRRGSVDVNLNIADEASSVQSYVINDQMVQAFDRQVKKLSKSLKIAGRASWDALLALPGVVVKQDQQIDIEADWARCSVILEQALDAFDSMRAREGKALVADVKARLQDLRNRQEALLKLAPEAKAQSVARHRERVSSLLSEDFGSRVASENIEREIVLISDRMDVSEELTRLDSHLEQMQAILGKGGEIGKKLDFLTQELLRETNTIGSKAQNKDITYHVIEMKGTVEKIREQVQNLE